MPHFRAIALCNSTVKIITKVIANRLRGLVTNLEAQVKQASS